MSRWPLWCLVFTLCGRLHAQNAPLEFPGTFSADGEVHLPRAERAYKLQLSTFAAYAPKQGTLSPGFGVGYSDPRRWLRPMAMFANDRIGAGLGVVVPTFDLGLGAGVMRNLATHSWEVSGYVVVYSW